MKQLLHSYILIKPDPELKTRGGFIIPDTAVKKSKTGEVIKVGDHITIDIKEGEQVLYSPAIATDYPYNGENHVIVRQQDIIAIL